MKAIKITLPPEVMPDGMAPSALCGLHLELRAWSSKKDPRHSPFMVIESARWDNSLEDLVLWVRIP